MDDNSISFPDPEVLPNDVRQKVPFFLVGDDAFALKENMMKSFSRRGLEMDKRIIGCLVVGELWKMPSVSWPTDGR